MQERKFFYEMINQKKRNKYFANGVSFFRGVHVLRNKYRFACSAFRTPCTEYERGWVQFGYSRRRCFFLPRKYPSSFLFFLLVILRQWRISLLFKTDYPIFAVRIDVSANKNSLFAESNQRFDLVKRKAYNFSRGPVCLSRNI